MFERLSAFFGARKERLKAEAEATKNSLVEAVARSQGIALSPPEAPSPVPRGLTPAQFRAFTAAYEALLERMVRAVSGLAPDFAELERKAIAHIAAAGWIEAAHATAPTPLAAQAAVAMLTGFDQRPIARAFAAEDMAAFRQAHAKALDRLRLAESAENTTLRRQLFTHPDCADAFVLLTWRDEGHRTHTNFDIILGFGAPFAEAMTEAMLADVVFQTFRRSFAHETSPGRLVTGGIALQYRDGLATHFAGMILPDRLVQRLAGEGLVLPPCLLGLALYERML